jgi:protein SCO1/2
MPDPDTSPPDTGPPDACTPGPWRSWRLLGVLCAIAVVATALLVTTTVLATRNLDAKLALRPEPGMESLSIPPFAMTDQRGRTITEGVFTNNLTILEFGFTHCPGACPIMMDQMLRLQGELRDTPVRFVFVSVDPAHDTPERLAGYARDNGVDPDRWTLLTGEIEAVRHWLTAGLNLSIETQPDSPIELDDGTTMPNIAHPTHLILVGPDSRILGLTPAFAPEEVDRLAERVKTASRLWRR